MNHKINITQSYPYYLVRWCEDGKKCEMKFKNFNEAIFEVERLENDERIWSCEVISD